MILHHKSGIGRVEGHVDCRVGHAHFGGQIPVAQCREVSLALEDEVVAANGGRAVADQAWLD